MTVYEQLSVYLLKAISSLILTVLFFQFLLFHIKESYSFV